MRAGRRRLEGPVRRHVRAGPRHPATFFSTSTTSSRSTPRTRCWCATTRPRFRRSRLWLEAVLRKTPVPLHEPGAHRRPGHARSTPWTSSARPSPRRSTRQRLRPRLLIADAVGLGKTLEIGMILAELIRRGRGGADPRRHAAARAGADAARAVDAASRSRSSASTPTGIQRVRQQLPASRNPFTYFKRVIISIDTLKTAALPGPPGAPAVGRRGHRRVAQPHQRRHPEQRARPRARPEHRGADPRLGHPAQRQGRSRSPS